MTTVGPLVDPGKTLPILSIVIPTRNRVDYVTSAISSILSIPSKEFELVILDTSDSTDLRSHIANHLSDSRLRYDYVPAPTSLTNSFNRGNYSAIA